MAARAGRYVALLRGVNVGGNRKIAMADLRAFMAAIGFEGAQTLLQSGNVVFDARGTARNWNTVRKLSGMLGQ